MEPVTKPVFLEWGHTPNSRDKTAPLLVVDPNTKAKTQTSLSKSVFNGPETVRYFIEQNNLYVETAEYWGIDTGEAYSHFFELGIRISQQLEGRFRDVTFDRYDAAKQQLQQILLDGILAERKQRRDAGLESLLQSTDGVPSDDISRITGYVGVLKQRPVRNRTEVKDNAPKPSFRTQVDDFRLDQDTDDSFVKNYLLAHPGLKADYFATVEVAVLHGWRSFSLHEVADKIADNLLVFGVENGRLYLKVLRGLMVHFGEISERVVSGFHAATERVRTAGADEKPAAFASLNEAIRSLRGLEHPVSAYEGLNSRIREILYDAIETQEKSHERLHAYLSRMSTTQDSGQWLHPLDCR